MQYHAIPFKTMQNHAIPCNTMQYHAISCNTMQYHAIPCNTMQYHAIPCNTMQYHAIPWNINNCWRSVPLPCGQYNGHFFFNSMLLWKMKFLLLICKYEYQLANSLLMVSLRSFLRLSKGWQGQLLLLKPPWFEVVTHCTWSLGWSCSRGRNWVSSSKP